MSNYLVSLIRTGVPILVGTVFGYITSLGWFDVAAEDQAKVTAAVVGGAIAVYYAAIRKLEQKWPWIGAFLGSTQQPAYSGTTSPLAGEGGAVTIGTILVVVGILVALFVGFGATAFGVAAIPLVCLAIILVGIGVLIE